jgi:hypothetical protein
MAQPKGTAGTDHFGQPVRLAATWEQACKAINAIHSYGSTVLHAFVCTLPKHPEDKPHASFDLAGRQIAGWWDHRTDLALTAKQGFVSVGARPVGEPAEDTDGNSAT